MGGEEAAAGWYQSRGYEVVARNWRGQHGELDLVLRRSATIVFCEVKTRSSVAFGEPHEAVTRTKQLRIRRLALEWLAQQGRHPRFEIRFDVASVRAGAVEVLEGAF